MAEFKGAELRTSSASVALKTLERRGQTESKAPSIALQRVPIRAIFKVEFEAFQYSPRAQKQIRSEYNRYVVGLMNSVSVWLGFGEASKTDPKKLADAIKSRDERELFMFLSEAFQKDFGVTYKSGKMLSTSIFEMHGGVFNCYSSSVLLADVLTRLGKPVKVILPTRHMFLAGEEYAFETTSTEPERVTFSLSQLDSRYPRSHGLDVENMLSLTCNWVGAVLKDMGRYEEALSSIDKTIMLDPKDVDAWFNKGSLLYGMGRHEEALSAFDKVIELNPQDADVYHCKAIVLSALLRHGEAKFYRSLSGKRSTHSRQMREEQTAPNDTE